MSASPPADANDAADGLNNTIHVHSQAATPSPPADANSDTPQNSDVPERASLTAASSAMPTSNGKLTAAEQSNHQHSEPSPSANEAIKEEDDSSNQMPYSTRSRNRTTTRPNYAEDGDADLDATTVDTNKPTNKRSSTSQLVTKRLSQPSPIDVSMSDADELQSTDGNNSGNVSSSETSGAHATIEKPNGQRKRKLGRPPGSRSAANNLAATAKASIPGTSQFLALSSATPEPPVTKRRKLGHSSHRHSSDASPVSNGPPAVKRASSSHIRASLPQSSLVTFEKSKAVLRDGKLEADDGEVYAVNDMVYLVCEPPGEPYYLCRIMEFRRANADDPKSPVKSMLVNWFYRPKDISRYNSDPRYVYASMQSDDSPITSLRGKCQIRLRPEIADLEEYRKSRDTFWYNQLYDRYIHRAYEVVPVNQIINVPEKVKKVLDEHWKYIVVEPARMKELTSAVKLCKRCSAYCAPNDSVDCGVCRNTYHMTCVSPPLVKKPSRGFAWSCGPCSRAQERKLEERHATLIVEPGKQKNGEHVEEEEEDASGAVIHMPDSEPMQDYDDDLSEPQAETTHADMWPYRYLGIHCRVEDVLQLDDRAIYPRATSRLGPRHQATVPSWPGRPIQLVKPVDVKRKYLKGTIIKKETKLSRETVAALEAEKVEKANRPKWVQDAPVGYVARGEDLDESDPKCTAKRLFIVPEEAANDFTTPAETSLMEERVDDYMAKARAMWKAPGTNVPSTNFLDKALRLLDHHKFDSTAALKQLETEHSPKALGDPVLSKEELKKFEDGVSKFGSELRRVRKHVGTKSYGEIVRFYYIWKKTPRGREIWGNFDGRRVNSKKKTTSESSWTDLADDEDDSAFDNDKCSTKKKGFECKFCATRTSRRWRRAPNVAPGATVPADPKISAKDKSNHLILALCERCAIMWRRYAMRWEDPEEIAKTFIQQGSRAVKRRVDEDLLREVVYASEAAGVASNATIASAAAVIGVPVSVQTAQDPGRKKSKPSSDKEQTPVPQATEVQTKKKAPPPPPPRAVTPPIVPQQPRMRDLPCGVCKERAEPTDPNIITCRDCRMAVHRRCYAVPDTASAAKWLCDTCLNDKNWQLSFRYKCILCPIVEPLIEMTETPKVTHKKKTERDREREKLERDLALELAEKYRRDQEEKGKPIQPREAFKSTVNSNWIHASCAVWMPEMRFMDVDKMDKVDGFYAVRSVQSRADALCKLCKINWGSCVFCQQCHEPFHISCASEAGYTMGFDITPVKATRKDLVSTVTLGSETGTMTAAIWCKEHTVKTIIHPINEIESETGLTALQLYVRTYKKADLSTTGTVRKAVQLTQSTKAGSVGVGQQASARRDSQAPNGMVQYTPPPLPTHFGRTYEEERRCTKCGVEDSIYWWGFDRLRRGIPTKSSPTNGVLGLGTVDSPEGPVEVWECHRCHMEQEHGVSAEPNVLSSNDMDTTPPAQKLDFFSLTEPATTRPAPSQLSKSEGYNWPASMGQSPQLAQSPRSERVAAPTGNADQMVDHWTRQLSTLVINVNNTLNGTRLRLMGREIGTLDDVPMHIWSRLISRVMNELSFDPQKQIMRTEDGQWLDGFDRMMAELGNLLRTGKSETEWKIVLLPLEPGHTTINYVPRGSYYDPPLPLPPYFPPPHALRRPSETPARLPLPDVAASALPPGPAVVPPGVVTMAPGPATIPSGLAVLPPGPAATSHVPSIIPSGPAPLAPLPTATMSSPYFNEPRRPLPVPGYPTTVNARPARDSLPREQGGAGGPVSGPSGASSSPNLKNLMH